MAKKFYEKPSADQLALLQEVMSTYHQQRLGDVTIGLLVAHAECYEDTGEPKGPALLVRGVPALGATKINSLKLRAHGLEDAEIVIDGDRWKDLSRGQRLALIDHELTHLELNTTDSGTVRRDDLDRPRLKMRGHDHEFGWFDEVAERHGAASIEVHQAKRFVADHGQYYFDFGPGELQFGSRSDAESDAEEGAPA